MTALSIAFQYSSTSCIGFEHFFSGLVMLIWRHRPLLQLPLPLPLLLVLQQTGVTGVGELGAREWLLA
jgi:hypothetical protein